MSKALLCKHLILWFCVLFMTGCASGGSGRSVGRMIDTTHVRDIQKGQSKQQIYDWFGAPYSTSVSDQKDSQGRAQAESWTYSYGWSNADKTQSQTLIVVFDKEGKVIERQFTEKNK